MISEFEYWQSPPDRDIALEKAFSFVTFLSEGKMDESNKLVAIADVAKLKEILDASFKSYLKLIVDDEEWDDYMANDLTFYITTPFDRDEDKMEPLFSGNSFILNLEEIFSFKLLLREQITPVRMHFKLEQNSNGYYLKLIRITADS